MRRALLALALAILAISPALADRLEEYRYRIEDEYKPSLQRIERRLGELDRFDGSEEEHERLRVRHRTTRAGMADTVRRQGEYRRSIGIEDKPDAEVDASDDGDRVNVAPTGDLPPMEGSITPGGTCTPATESEKVAFCSAAGLGDSACARLDFSCGDAASTTVALAPVTSDDTPVSVTSSTNTIVGGASPVGNYQLVWDGTGLSDFTTQEAWHAPGVCAGGYGDACSDPANVSEANGVITLNGQPCSKAAGKSYCGAEITTRGIKDFTHGYIEVEAKTPESAGAFHAAGWLMGNGSGTTGWPNTGEVDFAEGVVDGEEDGKVYMTAHWGGEGCPGGHCSLPAKGAPVVTNSEWNTYGLERTPDALIQYVNGQKTGEITRAQVAAKGGNFDVLFNSPMHYRADMAAGGPWAAPNRGTLEPGAVQIKSVRMYE